MSSEHFLFQFFRGNFSFEIQETCKNEHNIDINKECHINFSGDDTVESFGSVEPGGFKANPDVAGIGVVVGFSPGLFLVVLSGIFLFREMLRRWIWVRQRTRPGVPPKFPPRGIHKLFEPPAERNRFMRRLFTFLGQLLIANADTQLFIALAYGINFVVSSKCTLSAYHYEVGLNMVLLALASTNLSTLMLRDYWARAKIAATLRTLVIIVIYIFLGRMIAYQFMRESTPEEVWLAKLANSNPDSSILLPASCFLDPDLDPLRGLTDAQMDRVGGNPGSDTVTPEVIMYAFLALCFVLAHAAHVMRALRGHRDPKRGRPAFVGLVVILYWTFCLGISAFVYAWCYGNVWVLRMWVHQSGWMEDDAEAERDVRGIGQLVPVVAMCFAVVWAFDRSKRPQ